MIIGTRVGQITNAHEMHSNNVAIVILEWTKLVCTPASTALFACPGWTDCVQVRYRHIRQAAIPARVVLGTASRFVRCTCASLPCHFRIYKIGCLR